MESALVMLAHGAILAVVLFLVMRYVMNQTYNQSLTRSIFFGLLAGLYMVMFGHGPPNKLNPNLF